MARTQNARRWITQAEAADRLGVTDRTIRNLIARGEVPAYRLGTRAIRIESDDIDALLHPIATVGGAA